MKSAVAKVEKASVSRLPCRGCTRHCKNFDRCEGRPWRLLAELKPQTEVIDK